MTAHLPADAFVPVPIRWRHVAAGDVFVGRDGRLWHVTNAAPSPRAGTSVVAVHADDVVGADVDPDEVVHVLVPVTERDAVELCIDELGARLMAGRTT